MGVIESSLNSGANESHEQRRPALVRSPSAPARVSSLISAGASKCLQKRVSEPFWNDATAHVSVFADEACAVYKAHGLKRNLHRKELRHSDCHYTCHPECGNMTPVTSQEVDDRSFADDVVLEEINPNSENAVLIMPFQEDDVSEHPVDSQELKEYVDRYNDVSPMGLGITLEENGKTFHGFIRVHMNLFRPISVVAGTRPPSIYDILHDDENVEKTLTSFYLPRDTVKTLHITSETTTQEVIATLLKKFRVVDSPKKFALYERFYEQKETLQAKMRRISDNSKPLLLALHWSRDTACNKRFVLQENDTGDILWEAFTLPELKNFLLILDHEEEEYKKLIKQKYELLESKIKEAMIKIEKQSLKEKLES